MIERFLEQDQEGLYEVIPRWKKNHLHWMSRTEIDRILRSMGNQYMPRQVATLIWMNQNGELYFVPDRHLMHHLGLGEDAYMKLCSTILRQWENRLEAAAGQSLNSRPSEELEDRIHQKEMLRRYGIYSAENKHLYEAYQQQLAERKR
jgi:hypothetical protein